jgi:hypothetical protein
MYIKIILPYVLTTNIWSAWLLCHMHIEEEEDGSIWYMTSTLRLCTMQGPNVQMLMPQAKT